MLGWSIIARACRSCSKRGSTACESMPGLMSFERDLALDRLGLLGDPDLAHAPFADLLLQRVAAGDEHVRQGGVVVRSAVIAIGDGSTSGFDVCTPVAPGAGRPRPESMVASPCAGGGNGEASLARSSASTRPRSSASSPHSRSR